jgi:nitrogen fixation protein FixH
MKLPMNWGTGIALVYAAFACGTLGVVALATAQQTDLVSADYYARSMQQDARREAVAHAQALGSELRVDPDADRQGLLITVPGAQVPSASGTITWYRPSDAHADVVIPLQVDRDGRQRLSFAGLRAGHWLLQLAWTAGGRAYYDERAVQIP